jgi:hypothetical protein
MAESTMEERVAVMRSTLQSIEAQLARGEIPPHGLEDLKAAVDDMRLRVWSILTAAAGDDYAASLERFRLRRAIEICKGVAGDLRNGKVNARHRELARLRNAAHDLTRQIDTSPAS